MCVFHHTYHDDWVHDVTNGFFLVISVVFTCSLALHVLVFVIFTLCFHG